MAFNATSIFELDKSLPQGTDSKSFGDDNIREIKNVLKTSFPNSPIGDKYEGTLGQLTDLAAGATLPRDSVIMWAGSQVTLTDGPEGWTICDGRARKSGGGNAPDFRGLFPFGAQADNGSELFIPRSGDQGGNNEIDIRDIATANLHTFTTNGHALTTSEIPNHAHNIAGSGVASGTSSLGANDTIAEQADNLGTNHVYDLQPGGNPAQPRGISSSKGGNVAHTHQFKIDGSSTFTGANIPAYLAIVFLIKD